MTEHGARGTREKGHKLGFPINIKRGHAPVGGLIQAVILPTAPYTHTHNHIHTTTHTHTTTLTNTQIPPKPQKLKQLLPLFVGKLWNGTPSYTSLKNVLETWSASSKLVSTLSVSYLF